MSLKSRYQTNINNTQLKLTAATLAFHVPGKMSIYVFDRSPEEFDDNEWRRQRRLVSILDSEVVMIESPCLEAIFFHSVVLVATTT